jgi:hypothetical protein
MLHHVQSKESALFKNVKFCPCLFILNTVKHIQNDEKKTNQSRRCKLSVMS